MSLTTNRSQHGHQDPPCIDEMRNVCQQWTKDSRGRRMLAGSHYNRLLLRPISIYVTWLFVRIGIAAHTATFLMTVAGLMGVVVCLPHSLHLTIVGGVCFFLFDLLDAVDGEIARWNRSSSTRGLYLDQISHVFVEYPSRGVAGLHLYFWTSDSLYLVLGIAAFASSITSRAVREICLRVNAESPQVEHDQVHNGSSQSKAHGLFAMLRDYLKTKPLITFPVTKPRLIHIMTVTGILLTYWEWIGFLKFFCWFYALYCTAWLVLEVPYYYYVRLVNVSHVKPVHEYKWPI